MAAIQLKVHVVLLLLRPPFHLIIDVLQVAKSSYSMDSMRHGRRPYFPTLSKSFFLLRLRLLSTWKSVLQWSGTGSEDMYTQFLWPMFDFTMLNCYFCCTIGHPVLLSSRSCTHCNKSQCIHSFSIFLKISTWTLFTLFSKLRQH